MNLWKTGGAAWAPLTLILVLVLVLPACTRQVSEGRLEATNAAALAVEPPSTNAAPAVAPLAAPATERFVVSFGLEKVAALQVELFEVPLWQYLASLIFLLLALGCSKLLDYLVKAWLTRWAARTRTKLDDLLIGLLQGPVKVVAFVVLLHVGLQVLPWPAWIARWISKGLQVTVACSITYMVLRSIDVLVDYWKTRARAREDRVFNDQLFPLISNTMKTFAVVVAVLVTSQNLGLNITAMLASLSIGGLALGLAAQDTVANLFGAFAVYVDKPFRVGDRIRLDNIDGVVESIGLRSTRVRNLDGFLVTIPNKTMGNATITNITRRPSIKTQIDIGLTYDTPTAKVRRALEILNQVYGQHSCTLDLVVSFDRFADSSLNLRVIHWWKPSDFKTYAAGMQELNLAVKEQFDAEHIEFAFPTRTLYLKQEPGVAERSGQGATRSGL